MLTENILKKESAFLVLLLASIAMSPSAAAEEIKFSTGDGITVYGDLYRADAKSTAPLILLFHQAGGDARGEYGPLVGRLRDAGYHALAIDQRLGGDRFGGLNRTMAGVNEDDFGYCDVYPELEGALRQARILGFSGKVVAWGSSYSAALVFQLAAKNPHEIDAVLAFSPASGGPLAECAPKLYSAKLSMPVLALRPRQEMDVPSVPPQMERFRSDGHSTYISDPGVHGSSMLNDDRVGASTDETWEFVLGFLAESLAD